MHVLIIEDDAKTADFVAGAFRQSGYVCTICADGLEGSVAALANEYARTGWRDPSPRLPTTTTQPSST